MDIQNHKPSEYKAIYLWGKQSRSFMYYIEAQQEKAAKDNAPIDALYVRYDSIEETKPRKWVCVSDLVEDHQFRSDYAHYLKTGEVKS